MRFRLILTISLVVVVVAASSAFASSSARSVTSSARSSAVPPSADLGNVAGTTASTGTGDPAPSAATLPFTGIDLRLAIVLGAGLILGGAVVRRRFGSD